MIDLYSAQQAKQLDITSQQEYSIPEEVLMEDASFASYNLIKEDIQKAKHALFVAGGGNNGGDALALARLAYLDNNCNITIMLAQGQTETNLRKKQREICQKLNIPTITMDDQFPEADLIIDGLFGIGLKDVPRSKYQLLIDAINQSNAKVIALDVPSGLGDEVPYGISVKADTTICMGVSKKALYLPQNRDYAGKIVNTFPFFPKQAKPETNSFLLTTDDESNLSFKYSDYKKTRGSIAIIGGSGRYTGAVILAAKAAFHAGVGLVTIFTEQHLITTISKSVPSAMVTSYDQIQDLNKFDAVLCGPGMGKSHDDILKTVLESASYVVLDADGIRALARNNFKAPETCKLIMTPHLGEYSALVESFAQDSDQTTPQNWLDTLVKVKEKTNAYAIAVKANTVWLAINNNLLVVDGQNPSLGVAGSGDVLSGLVTALVAGGFEKATENAILLHQKAGQRAQNKLGFYSSDELIKYIGLQRKGQKED